MMAEEYELETREKKAFHAVSKASKELARRIGQPELGDAVATANHQDPQVRNMRRMEALAPLLEALAAANTDEAKPKAKTTKGENE